MLNRANFLYPIKHEWWGTAASACWAGDISTGPWRTEEVWLLINVLKGDDERRHGGYPFSGLSWPLCLLKWSVRPWPIMFSLIIISRYSAFLSGRGCYQRTTHSEDERGINTQALESCTYSQGWPVLFPPKSFISAYMIHDCYSGLCVKISAISPSAIIAVCGIIWKGYTNEITTQKCIATKKEVGFRFSS